jgi:hypothetical protein
MTEIQDEVREAVTWGELEARRVAAERRQHRRRIVMWFVESVVLAAGTWLWSRGRHPVTKAA